MNVKIAALSLAQCCFWFATLVGISLSAVIGLQLSPRAELATLPLAFGSLGALMSTYALSMYMQRYGRRAGLRLGATVGMSAAVLTCVALQQQSFWLFCIASLIMGCYQASSVYYRLAAMDEAEEHFKSTAMSWVLCGALLAALFGPTLAKFANGVDLGTAYMGPYLLVFLFTLIGFAAIGLLEKKQPQAPQPKASTYSSLPNSLMYWAGVVNTGFAQFLMMLMMVITPLAMHADGFAVSVSLSVIGWHIIGMFLPSFFSGKMIDRWGVSKILVTGYVVYGFSALVALTGHTATHYYLSLFLLGIAWNFVYVAGTTQYNTVVNEGNRGKAQGIAEFSISLAGTVAVFAGGVMINQLSWSSINIYVLALLGLLILFNLVHKARQSEQPIQSP